MNAGAQVQAFSARRCRGHADRDAVARCVGCGDDLCGECHRFTIDDAPGCARCAYEASTRRARRLSLAVVFLGLGAGLGTWLTVRFELGEDVGAIVVGALVMLGVTAGIVWSALSVDPARVALREDEAPREVLVEPPGGASYRAAARRVVQAVSPRVSARATGLVVLAAFVVAALLVPGALRQPRWIEAELVLLAWWAIVGATLSVLLYRGYRLKDDYAHFVPWRGGVELPASRRRGLSDLPDLSGCGDAGEGCAGAVVAVVLLVAALGVAWLVVELVLPIAFLLAYALFLAAIARVANDRHGCEGALGKALAWGLGWASLYVGPLALLVWLAHRF